MGRGWKTFEAHHKKILDSLKQIVGRNMGIKIPAGEDSEESKKQGRESLYHLRKYICVVCNHKQNIARNVKVKTQKELRNMLLKVKISGSLQYSGREFKNTSF